MLVGYLGELAPTWWASHFFGQSAMAFLTPVFGRSAHQAQYQGVLEAARRVHDEHIGVGRTLHLFHMPEHYEQGDYDWAHLSMAYWPERVREKCATDKSLAIAHDLEHLYVEPEPAPKKTRGRKKNTGSSE